MKVELRSICIVAMLSMVFIGCLPSIAVAGTAGAAGICTGIIARFIM